MNNYNDENNIRPPEPIKREQLIDTNFNLISPNNDFDLHSILEQSKNEYNSLQEQEEEKYIQLICNQSKEERQNKFNTIKTQLNKIIIFDRAKLKHYELVLSIIEMYELGVINEYKINESMYKNIFNILKTIRLPIEEIENVKKIIVYE